MYLAIWRKIIEFAPQILENPISVLGDYEAAPHPAINALSPNAILRGCWFHFIQALSRKWIILGLFNAPLEILWMCMSLPLLPAREFEAGLSLIQMIADAIGHEHPQMLQFLAYMRLQWLPRKNIVCVYRCSIRTNNEVEAFNRQLPQRFGGTRQNIYTFISRLNFMFWYSNFLYLG